MRKIFIVFIIFIIIDICLLAVYLFYNNPRQLECYAGGGFWDNLSTICGDSCSALDSGTACEQVQTLSCDCGPDKCWNGNMCIKNEDYKSINNSLKK